MTSRRLAAAAVLGLGIALLAPVGATAAPLDLARPEPAARTLAADFTHAAFLDANGGVWTSGFQGFGALGNGVASATTAPNPTLAALPGGVRATKVDVGGDVTVVLGEDGVVYGTGRNDLGQLTGPEPTKTTFTAFTWAPVVGTPPTVLDLSTSDLGTNTVVLGADGALYDTGPRGGGASAVTALTPSEFPFPTGADVGTPTSVVAGTGYTLVVTDTGRLYGIGTNKAGRLGASASAALWFRLDATSDVVAAIAGDSHSAWLTSGGTVYSQGSDNAGQLGNGPGTVSSAAPVATAGLWVGIAGDNGDSTVLLSAAGTTSVIGTMPSSATAQVPTAIADTGLVVREVGSSSVTFLMRTSSGKVYGAGRQNFQQLGTGANPLGSWLAQDAQPTVPTTSSVPSGPVQVGTQLTARSGDFVPAPTTVSYEWRFGTAPGVLAASTRTFTPAASDVGKDLYLEVTAAGDDLVATSREEPVGTVAPGTFAGGGFPQVSGGNVVGGTLTATDPATTPVASVTWQWTRDGVAIPGATTETYSPVPSDVGRSLAVTATRTAPGYTTATATTVVGTVATATLTGGGVPVLTGSNGVGKTLTATAPPTTPGSTPTWRWTRDGVAIPGASTASYTPVVADAGRRVAVRVTRTAVGYTPVTTTSAARLVPAFNTVRPAISGQARLGRRLRTTRGTWAAPGHTFDVRWLRNGKPIARATSFSYRVTSRDRGKQLTVRVTATRVGWASVTAISKGKRIAG